MVEVEAQQAKAEARSAKAVTLQHGRRITALEGQQSKRPAWTPRDWLRATRDTGVGNPAAANAEKGKRFFEAVTQKIAAFLVELAGADLRNLYE
ncbi:hypothetical protein HUU05_18530 [candidate division KSB1 bacterium]|nr:hypothetical protein [candidate division KSB1 bacterium]